MLAVHPENGSTHGSAVSAKQVFSARLSAVLRSPDPWLLASAALLLVPIYRLSALPFRLDLPQFAEAYWLATAAESIFIAVVLAVLCLPLRLTLAPWFQRLRAHRGLQAMTLAFTAALMLWLGPALGLMLAVDAFAIAELMQRRGPRFESAALDVLLPAAYLFCVILLLYSCNHALAALQYAGAYDDAAARLDATLFHVSVSGIAHWAQLHLPGWAFVLLSWAYFGLYGRLGAVLVLTALLDGRRETVKMVRAMFFAYAISLVFFALFPVKGPYLTCVEPSVAHAQSLPMYFTQHALVTRIQDLYAHRTAGESGTIDLLDYYIGFPSMHAGLPLIALWFVRRRKRIAALLVFVYLVLLLPATVLLEWHYLIDLVGGWAVAALAVALAERLDPAPLPARRPLPQWAEDPILDPNFPNP